VSKYAEVLRPFVALMEKELNANSHKGDREGWLKMTEEQALGEIEYHVSKLSKAMTDMNPEDVREYAADVANLCMMLLDIGGQLKAAQTPPQPIYDEAKERQLFEDSMIEASEEAGFGEPDLYRDSAGCYRQEYHQAAWGGWLACAQSRAKAGEVGHE
jgi:hypothetical protein